MCAVGAEAGNRPGRRGDWGGRLLSEPPWTFPAAWSTPPSAEAALWRAARECGELAAQPGGGSVVRALCDVTAERLLREDEEADLALALTARMLDALELEGDDVETVLLEAACRRCAATCRRALIALCAEAPD